MADVAGGTLADLPLIEIPVPDDGAPAALHGDVLAVWYSGDGGWSRFDDAVARRLAAGGVPVVGVSTLRCLWHEVTPVMLARDFTRIAAHYREAWSRTRVALVGFSFGADIAPFIAARLEGAERDDLALLGLLSPGREASFEFHVTEWLHVPRPGTPIVPEMRRLQGLPTLCLYGLDEADTSLCTVPATAAVDAAGFAGGHHLEGDYERIATLLLDALPRRGD